MTSSSLVIMAGVLLAFVAGYWCGILWERFRSLGTLDARNYAPPAPQKVQVELVLHLPPRTSVDVYTSEILAN